MGLAPVWVTPNGVFAITLDGQERYVNEARSLLNPAPSVALSKNKYVTRLILQRHNMQNIAFAHPRIQADAEAFLKQHKKIIAKPVLGAGSRDIHIVTTNAQLAALDIAEYILEKYIAGKELRYLVLDGKVIGVHHSEYGTSVSETRPLQRISYPEAVWNAGLVDTSLRIVEILNLKFAAVDYLIDASGRAYILEVNSMPGLKWFHAPSSGPAVDVAGLFLKSTINSFHAQRPITSGALASRPAVAYS